MGRERMVTRTIISTEVVALVVNLNDGTTEVKTITLPRVYKDAEDVLKYCRKFVNNDEISVVKVIEMKENEQLYGMSEKQFLELAKPIERKSEE